MELNASSWVLKWVYFLNGSQAFKKVVSTASHTYLVADGYGGTQEIVRDCNTYAYRNIPYTTSLCALFWRTVFAFTLQAPLLAAALPILGVIAVIMWIANRAPESEFITHSMEKAKVVVWECSGARTLWHILYRGGKALKEKMCPLITIE